MVKLLILLRKRADLTDAAFRGHWRDTHAPIVWSLPGIRNYVQFVPGEGAYPFAADYQGVAELWFDDEAALRSAMSSPEDAAAREDTAYFADIANSVMMVVREFEPEG